MQLLLGQLDRWNRLPQWTRLRQQRTASRARRAATASAASFSRGNDLKDTTTLDDTAKEYPRGILNGTATLTPIASDFTRLSGTA